MKPVGTIFFLSGKMGAGKTTFATTIAKEQNAIVLSEDELLSAFYPEEVNNMEDYIKYFTRMKPFLQKQIGILLKKGNNVVLDFPGNTIKQRSWFKKILEESNATHILYYLDVSDEICLNQIQKRRMVDPSRHAFDTQEVFRYVTSFFQEPSKDEGFEIKHIIKN